MPATDPVPPFGAELAAVKPLVPEAPVAETLGPGERGVTAAQVHAWITSLSSRVDVRLTGWRSLRAEPTAEEVDEGTQAPRARLAAAAADLVHNGAASYLEAARFPERAAQADTSYAAVLWARFESGLDELATWLEAELEEPTTDPGAPPADELTLAYSFPPPSFTPDALRW